LADDAQRVRSALLRRNEQLDAIGEKQEAYFVVISNGTECEEAGYLGSKLTFRLRGAPKISRSAHIDDQHHSELALFRKFLYERTTHPRSDVPVNRANLISRLILPHVFKVHSASFENAVVIAGKRGFDQASGFNLKRPNLLQDFGRGFRALVIPSGSGGCGSTGGI